MRATTIGMPEAPAAPGLERLTTILLLAFVGAVQLSIAAAQILLGALLLCWITGMVRDKSPADCAHVLRRAARLRRDHADLVDLLDRAARKLHRRSPTLPLPHRACRVRPGSRPSRHDGNRRHRDRGRRCSGVWHRAVRDAPLRQPGPATPRHTRPLHDLLGQR